MPRLPPDGDLGKQLLKDAYWCKYTGFHRSTGLLYTYSIRHKSIFKSCFNLTATYIFLFLSLSVQTLLCFCAFKQPHKLDLPVRTGWHQDNAPQEDPCLSLFFLFHAPPKQECLPLTSSPWAATVRIKRIRHLLDFREYLLLPLARGMTGPHCCLFHSCTAMSYVCAQETALFWSALPHWGIFYCIPKIICHLTLYNGQTVLTK